MSTKFSEAWKALDYKNVLTISDEASTAYEAYLCLRAELVLGIRQKMNRTELLNLLIQDDFLFEFIEVQKKIYVETSYQKAFEALQELKRDLPEDPAIRGDYHFVFGYCLNLLTKTKQATAQHRLAAGYYAKAGMKGAEAHALFNLCVSYNHLNEKELFDIVLSKLKQLALKDKESSAQYPYQRILVYLQINREEYSKAYLEASQVFEICKFQDRYRDYASLVCLLFYLSVKCQETEHFYVLQNQIKDIPASVIKHYFLAIKEFGYLEQKGFFTPPEVNHTLNRWKKTINDHISLIYLMDLLSDKLYRSRDYERLLKVARLGSRWAIEKEQALSLIDFRYYEAIAYLRLGYTEKAATLIQSYRSDAINDRIPLRIKKSNQLESELSQMRYPNSSNPFTESSESPFTLDPIQHRVTFDNQTIDLCRKPLIEKFLIVLVKEKKMVDIDYLFKEVYGYFFDSVRHERKMNSLIERVRKALGGIHHILRRDKKIGLHPKFRLSLQSYSGSESSILKRQHQILKILSLSQGPVTISELEGRFDFSRRTLQLDLKHLTETKAIRNEGNTKRRRYFIK